MRPGILTVWPRQEDGRSPVFLRLVILSNGFRISGVLRSQETPPSQDPKIVLYLGSYGVPWGGGLFLTSEVLM